MSRLKLFTAKIHTRESRFLPRTACAPLSLLRRPARLLALVTLLLLSANRTEAMAATYYVDNTNPAASDTNAGTSASLPWKTIQRAASVLGPGDTVMVLGGGSYNERVAPAKSGTASSGITYRAGTGTKPKLRGFTLSGRSYITISGFEVTNSGFSLDTRSSFDIRNATGVHILNNYIHHTTGAAVSIGNSNLLRIAGNRIAYLGIGIFAGGGAPAFSTIYNAPCHDVLIEQNDVSFVSDYLNANSGSNFVLRNNILGPSDPLNLYHIDGMQNNGVVTDSLVEGNYFVGNATSHNHVFLNQVSGSTGWILRYNYTFQSNGGIDWNNVDRQYFYNNTFVNTFDYYPNPFQILLTASFGNVARNNIWYRAVSTNGNPYRLDAGSTIDKDYDLHFGQGSTGQTHSVSGDPHFVDIANADYRLQQSSPAIDKGGHLTTVHSSDSGSGTTLVVQDSGAFQDGWAGISPDWIAIGSVGNVAQITSVNYAAGTITLAAPVPRSAGQPVWLYKNSAGTRVLYGSAPDIGAFESTYTSSSGTSSSGTSSADAIPPAISLTAPGASTSIVSASVTVSASASDNVGVAGVQFRLDGTDLGAEDTSAPYSVVWNTVGIPNGSHTLTAIARDAAGNRTTSASKTITVSNSLTDTTRPLVSMTTPLNGTTLKGSVTVSAAATDNVGVARVQFRLDGVNLGAADTTAPYSVPWNTSTSANGTHSLFAVATDSAGNQAISAITLITVNNADTTLPVVVVTAPTNGTIVKGTPALSANASDNIAIAGVQFQINDVDFGAEDLTAPYLLPWNTALLPNGAYTVKAVARDTSGNRATSAPVAVAVQNPSSTIPYAFTQNGGQRHALPSGAVTKPQYAILESGAAGVPSSGVAFVQSRSSTALIHETAIPTSESVSSGLVDVEMGGAVTTAVAFNNPGSQDVTVSYSFTDERGSNAGSGSAVVSPGTQISGFLDQLPFNGPPVMAGTFSFTASSPVFVSAVRGLTNESGELLLAALPVLPFDDESHGARINLPLFMYGKGWSTEIVLVNSTDVPQSGSISFFSQASGNKTVAYPVSAAGVRSGTFPYSIAPRGRFRLMTDPLEGGLMGIGVVRVNSAVSGVSPSVFGLLSYKEYGVVSSQVTVRSQGEGVAFRSYVEAAGTPGAIGYIRTHVTVANPGNATATVNFEARDLNGTVIGTNPVQIPPGGQYSQPIRNVVTQVPATFRGVLRITSSTGVIPLVWRETTNERYQSLKSTLPLDSDLETTNRTEAVFPLILRGGGYSTQLVVYSASGSSESGEIQLFDQVTP